MSSARATAPFVRDLLEGLGFARTIYKVPVKDFPTVRTRRASKQHFPAKIPDLPEQILAWSFHRIHALCWIFQPV
jgi:hypothetical protein